MQQLEQPKAPPPSPVIFGLESGTSFHMVPPSPILRGPLSGGIAAPSMPRLASRHNMHQYLSTYTCAASPGSNAFSSHQLMQRLKPMSAPSRRVSNSPAATLKGACAALLRSMPHAKRQSHGEHGSSNSNNSSAGNSPCALASPDSLPYSPMGSSSHLGDSPLTKSVKQLEVRAH